MCTDKTQNNIMLDLLETVDSDISTQEGTLINHSFVGAAVEFEQAYINLGVVEQNGNALTADREHLILRGRESGILPLKKTNAVWRAEFNINVDIGTRFTAGELTYICVEQMSEKVYRLMCERGGAVGNTKQDELLPIEFLSDYENGELTELLIPARDDEETEAYRTRYFKTVGTEAAFGGNRAQYKKMMHSIEGVGACKTYRVTEELKRIEIYFLDSLYKTPNQTLVSDVQEKVDPIGKQGEGEGEAAIFHIVDIRPCRSEQVEIEAQITLETGYQWEDLLEVVQTKLDAYYLELAKGWENEEYITVRILKVNAAIASVDGVIDVQNTMLNSVEENLLLAPNAIPVRGVILRKE